MGVSCLRHLVQSWRHSTTASCQLIEVVRACARKISEPDELAVAPYPSFGSAVEFGFGETDWRFRSGRKLAENGAAELAGNVLRSGSGGKYREKRPLAYFRLDGTEFLCSPDFVAKASGFELSVAFVSRGKLPPVCYSLQKFLPAEPAHGTKQMRCPSIPRTMAVQVA
jgi:hypothetical protein